MVEVGVGYVDRMMVALEGQPLEVVTGEVEPPPEIAELQQLGRDLTCGLLAWGVMPPN